MLSLPGEEPADARLSPLIHRTAPPPVMEARRWLPGVDFPPERPLINLSQAAPVDPPPEPLREAMAEMVRAEPDTHLYGPVLGLPALRSEIAWRWSAALRRRDPTPTRSRSPPAATRPSAPRSPPSPPPATR